MRRRNNVSNSATFDGRSEAQEATEDVSSFGVVLRENLRNHQTKPLENEFWGESKDKGQTDCIRGGSLG